MDESFGPRQLVLALDHADELRARGFPGGPVERRGADADRTLAGLAGPRDGAGRSGRVRARAISPRSGRSDRRARAVRRSCWSETDLPAAFATGALVLEDLEPGRPRRARAVSSAQSRARGGRAYVLITARSAPSRAFRVAHPRSGLAPARVAGGRARAARRRPAARADRQARRRPPTRGRRGAGELSRQPHRAIVRRRPRRGRRGWTRRPCASTGR